MLKLVNADDAQAQKPTPDAAPTVAARPATHDTAPPQALLDFMITRWREPSAKPPPRVRGHERFAARRRALSALFPGELLVVPTGHEKIRANDTTYRFRPGSDFYYLTGSQEPDGVLVLSPREGSGHAELLFVEPNPGKKDATFFTDRMKGELWVGPRLGVAGSQKRYGIERCLPLTELSSFLEGALPRAGDKVRVLRGFAPLVDAVKKESDPDKELATALSELRLVKDSMELAALRRAIDATKRGFEDVIRSLKRARSEREVEGVFNLRARVEGNDVGYNTIAASGANACVLHWTRNDGALRRGTLLLLDAGVESTELYTADITRTLPISGKLTKEQREIYTLVLAAQRAAFKAVRPGNDFMEPNKAAMRILAEGLERLGILTVGAEEALHEEKQFYKRYSLHNVSHMLGIDVHDCAKARAEAYKLGKLKPGMVLTVEPGLYFQTDDLTVPARYRGIGVRIEDDVVVTGKGCRILSDGIPREIEAVERWMERLWKSTKA